MSENEIKRKEIALTKELARRLKVRYPDFSIYANKCPSKSPKIKGIWSEVFGEACPPLQPEIDIIIFEPSSSKIRAIEMKYFERRNGRINQSFYKGIEQSLALLQWGFDNVALWQLFDASCSDDDIRHYGCKTWSYTQGILGLPIEFTPFRLIGEKLSSMQFAVIQADWLDNLRPIRLLNIDAPGFNMTYSHDNPLLDEQKMLERFVFAPEIATIVASRFVKEVLTLRQFLLDWLPGQRSGVDD